MSFWKKSIIDTIDLISLVNTELTEQIIELYWNIIDAKKASCNAESVMIDLYKKLSNKDLINIEEKFRRRTTYAYYHDLSSNNPDTFFKKTTSEEFKRIFYGLSTFSPNGYFREKSLRKLGNYSDGFELPFVILRLSDWVMPVFFVAEKILRDRLANSYSLFFLQNYDFIVKAKLVERNQTKDICDRIDTLLINDSAITYNILRATYLSEKSKNISLKEVILQKKLTFNELLDIYKKVKQPYAKQILLTKILADQQSNNLLLLQQLFAIKSSYRCKLEIIKRLTNFEAKSVQPFLVELLFNKFPSIRRIARETCLIYNISNFKELYINGLKDELHKIWSIAGIGEVGDKADLDIISVYINDNDLRIKKTALKAAAKLDLSILQSHLQPLLASKESCFSKFAKHVIHAHRHLLDNKQIEDTMNGTKFDWVKENCAFLLSTAEKWDAIIYITKYIEINDPIGKIFNNHLAIWNDEYNHSYTKPSQLQLQNLKDAIKRIKNQDQIWVSNLNFTIKGFE